MKQEYALGRFLRERYVNNTKLLNSSYMFKEVSKLNDLTM